MKTTKKVILAVGTLLSLITSLLWSSSDAGEKRAAPYFLILTFGALAAYIFLLLRSKHTKNLEVLRIAPKPNQVQQRQDANPKTKQESLPKAESTFAGPKPNSTPKMLSLGQGMGLADLLFPTGYGQLWTAYMEDVFHGIIWRWHYKPEIDNTPRNIAPYCLECEHPTSLDWWPVTSRFDPDRIAFRCRTHPHQPTVPLQDRYSQPFLYIRNLIQAKLKDGTWVDVVNRQKNG